MERVSFVLPIFNESENIPLLYLKLLEDVILSPRFDAEAEIIFINDGSRDGSLALLSDLAAGDERVRVIDLSRNYGHQIAVTAGLDYATGVAVIIMDSDLQDPPRVCLDLIDAWREGNEVVYAQRRTRQDGFFKKLTANLFYRILSLAAEVNIPRNTGDFRLLDRKAVDAVKRFPERDRFLRGLISSLGFRQKAVLFDRAERNAGETGYPLGKMIKLAVDGILGFSTLPIKLIRMVGWVVSTISVVGILYVLLGKVFFPAHLVPGWAFTVTAILFVGGVQIIMLSVLGSYIGRTYAEVQRRPLYLVSTLQNFPEKSSREAVGR